MDDFVASLPVIAGTVIVVILIFWLTNRGKRMKRQAILDLAAKEGWVYEPITANLEWGFRLKGQGWIFETLSRSVGSPSDSGSSNIDQSTRWHHARVPAADRLIYIGERPPGSTAGFAGGLIQQAIHLAPGGEAAGMAEVSAGAGSLRRRYLILSRAAADVEQLLTPQLETRLVNFPGPAPLIKLDADGTTIEIRGRSIETPAEILSIVRLGEAFLDAQKA